MFQYFVVYRRHRLGLYLVVFSVINFSVVVYRLYATNLHTLTVARDCVGCSTNANPLQAKESINNSNKETTTILWTESSPTTTLEVPQSSSHAGNIHTVLNRTSGRYNGGSLITNRDLIGHYFKRRLEPNHVTQIISMLKEFDTLMTKWGLEYLIHGGSLIGSYRHHGIVPWDDDVDVIVPLKISRVLYRALKELEPEYNYIINNITSWKLFSAHGQNFSSYEWKWPYMDIFFYDENNTHIWIIYSKVRDKLVLPMNLVRPVRRRPFMNLLLPAPCNPSAVLARTFDINICHTGFWFHRLELDSEMYAVPCSLLHSRFPFVRRKFINGGCNETLIQNGRIVGYFFDKNVVC